MKGSSTSSKLACTVALAGLTLLCSSAGGKDYVRADASIAGKEIHSFIDGGRNVTLVLGDFELTVGEKKVSGRDAVLWISTDSSGKLDRNDIICYVEAGKVSEPGGYSLTDESMVVTVHNEGSLRASGNLSDRPLRDFPLYTRGEAARERWLSGAAAAQTRPVDRPVTKLAAAEAGPPVKLSASKTAKPTPALNKPLRRSVSPAKSQTPAVASPVKAKAEPRSVQPVNFHADQMSYEFDEVGNRWITILRGDVYLSQGDADSEAHVELRSQAAVLFSAEGVESTKDSRSPYSPKLAKIKSTSQSVIGVYLEGDVVIARGERYLRGPSAYYDFTTDRAIVTDPVFRTVQKQRNIPIYIRASEARALSARELWFSDAKVSTSEFFTPTYHIGAGRAYVMDTTAYDDRGKRLSERAWHAKLSNTTFSIRGIPVLWSPGTQGDLEQGNSALRKATFGKSGEFGWGVETEWHLFRLLGLVKPAGFKGRFYLDWLERGVITGADLSYSRKNYTGYHLLYGVSDDDQKDSFGDDREDIEAPGFRGRVLMRHKQFLPNDWQLQFELSYICDRNFMEQFFPDEFYAGKEQETLLYAKKQSDNWAFTSLMEGRLNRFDEASESWPDLGLYLIGQPLFGDRLTLFHESHAGIKRYALPNMVFFAGENEVDVPTPLDDFSSGCFARLDMREEVDLPMHVGAINIVPYGVGRATYWGDKWPNSLSQDGVTWRRAVDRESCRPYGQVGVKANTHVWAVFESAESRLWDIHRLKHIITPEVIAFLASSHNVYPEELFPLDPGIEEHLERTSGMALNLYQRLQTKRGPVRDRRTVDWMRLNLSLGVYDNHSDTVPSDGRSFWSRPEYSLGRNHLNAEYFWSISDATMLLADANYDMDDKRLGKGNIGLAVQRDPRLRYYAGMRYIDDLDTAVGTLGVNYKINRKYSVSFFEQYDFAFDSGKNLATSLTITRKLPRWYAEFTISFDQSDDDLTLLVTFWPEGIDEVRIGAGKLSLLGSSDKN